MLNLRVFTIRACTLVKVAIGLSQDRLQEIFGGNSKIYSKKEKQKHQDKIIDSNFKICFSKGIILPYKYESALPPFGKFGDANRGSLWKNRNTR